MEMRKDGEGQRERGKRKGEKENKEMNKEREAKIKREKGVRGR
jgi:hypothetical protein